MALESIILNAASVSSRSSIVRTPKISLCKDLRLKLHKLYFAILCPGVDRHLTVDEKSLYSYRAVVVYAIHNIINLS